MPPRLKAAGVHLALSALLLAAVLAVMLLTWYPPPWWALLEVDRPLLVKLAMVLFGGPLLVAVVWKAGKWGLKFDLVVIGILQLVALGFCLYDFRQGRPLYAVFVVDRFNVITRGGLGDLIGTPPAGRDWRGPTFMTARLPTDPKAYDRLLTETLLEGKPDIDQRPGYWTGFEEAQALSAGRPLQAVADAYPGERARIARLADDLAREVGALRFLPLVGPDQDLVAVLDPDTAKPVALLDVNPWSVP